MPIEESRVLQARLLLACVNLASKAPDPLVAGDVTGRANLEALITQIRVRQATALNTESMKLPAFEYLINGLRGLKDQFPDATVAAFTTVKGTAAATDLQHFVWSLIGDAALDKNYMDVIDGAFLGA
jgi:hypothetical protein